jgi:hypothetical protein
MSQNAEALPKAAMEQAVELPRSSAAAVQQFLQVHNPMLCAEAAEVQALGARLGSPATGPSSPAEARQFMTDALVWLTRLATAGAGADWCVLLEG